MRKKSALIIGSAGVIALAIGLMKELPIAEVEAQSKQPKVENVQAFTNEGDALKVVTKDEQDYLESTLNQNIDQNIVITAEEQNMVENSTALSGFVPQENGPGFYFEKVK